MATIKVRILKRVGDPKSGVILAPGSLADLPEVWAARYIANGSAAAVADTTPEKPKAAKPKAKKDK